MNQNLFEEPQKELQRLKESIYYLKWAIVFAVVSVICNIFVVIGLVKNDFIQVAVGWGLSVINMLISIKLRNKADKVI